jgi:hypothetical protein
MSQALTRPISLCQSCLHVREIVSGTGSRFWLCQKSQTDARFPKYPPQPVVKCSGFEVRDSVKDDVQ